MPRLASSPACGPAASSSPFWPTALEPVAPAPEASEPAPTWEAGGGGGTFGFLLAQAVKPRQATNSTTRILRIHPSPKCRPRLAAFLLTHGLLNKRSPGGLADLTLIRLQAQTRQTVHRHR